MTTPSVGRIVHYVSYGTPGGEYPSVCRAAIVTAVNKVDSLDPSGVSLAVLNPSGMFFDIGLPYSEEHKGGTWHWPELF
jgi:hypothetical protein